MWVETRFSIEYSMRSLKKIQLSPYKQVYHQYIAQTLEYKKDSYVFRAIIYSHLQGVSVLEYVHSVA